MVDGSVTPCWCALPFGWWTSLAFRVCFSLSVEVGCCDISCVVDIVGFVAQQCISGTSDFKVGCVLTDLPVHVARLFGADGVRGVCCFFPTVPDSAIMAK